MNLLVIDQKVLNELYRVFYYYIAGRV